MINKKQATAIKTLIEGFSSAVKISRIKSITVEKRMSTNSYDVIIEPSGQTNTDWLAKELNEAVSRFCPLCAYIHDGKIIIS